MSHIRLRSAYKALGLVSQLRQKEGRQAVDILMRLGLSVTPAMDWTRRLKIAAAPLEYMRRAANVPSAREDWQAHLATEHYTKVAPGAFEGVSELLAHCDGLFERKKDQIVQSFEPPFTHVNERVSGGLVHGADDLKPIFKFLAQPAVFNAVASYLNEKPVLAQINLAYTAPNNEISSSQLFHRDMQDRVQVHLYVPIWKMTEENGPFTFYSGPTTDRFVEEYKKDFVRLNDDEVFSVIGTSDLKKISAEPGDLFFVNPFRCLHYGARCRSKPRLVMIVNFTSVFEGVEGLDRIYRASNRHVLDTGTPESRWLLNL